MRNWQGQGNLPKTSVVVTFIDKENVVTLLRTVHSIIQRTPADLLEEIILVEDNCVKGTQYFLVIKCLCGASE